MTQSAKRPAPPQDRPSGHHTDTADTTAQTDALAVDRRVVAEAGGDLWALLFDGVFTLARPCSECGRMLTASRSKAAGVGPRCAHRIAEVGQSTGAEVSR